MAARVVSLPAQLPHIVAAQLPLPSVEPVQLTICVEAPSCSTDDLYLRWVHQVRTTHLCRQGLLASRPVVSLPAQLPSPSVEHHAQLTAPSVESLTDGAVS